MVMYRVRKRNSEIQCLGKVRTTYIEFDTVGSVNRGTSQYHCWILSQIPAFGYRRNSLYVGNTVQWFRLHSS